MTREPDDGDGESNGGDDDVDRRRPALAARRDLDDVYEAAEDSHLLATAVREAVESGDRALDVGTGSGYVALAMADAGASVVGVDVNPRACERARKKSIPVVRGDLVSAFGDGEFDIVACNPPYLPEPEDGGWNDWMEAALSGGEDSRAVIEPLLDDVGRVLAPDGRVFLLVSSLTDVDAVLSYARERGLAGEEVASEKHAFERLFVLTFSRTSSE